MEGPPMQNAAWRGFYLSLSLSLSLSIALLYFSTSLYSQYRFMDETLSLGYFLSTPFLWFQGEDPCLAYVP